MTFLNEDHVVTTLFFSYANEIHKYNLTLFLFLKKKKSVANVSAKRPIIHLFEYTPMSVPLCHDFYFLPLP